MCIVDSSLHDAQGISVEQSPSPTAIALHRSCSGCGQQWQWRRACEYVEDTHCAETAPAQHEPGKGSDQRYKHYGKLSVDAWKFVQGEDVQRAGKAFSFVVDRINGDTRLETWPTAPGQSDAQPKASHEHVAHRMQSYEPVFAEDGRELKDARENGWSVGWTRTSPPATHRLVET